MSILNDLKYNILKIINTILSPIDILFLADKTHKEDKNRPIFIVGPPRSGTTLLYQILVKNFHLPYINNFIGKFYKFPVIASKINKLLKLNTENIYYKSRHGKTEGLAGPNEFGNFWYRWFPRDPQFVGNNYLNRKEKFEIRKIIYNLQNILGKNIVFKNVVNSVRIEALLELFPNSVFLISRRKPIFNIQSIYKMRKKLDKEDSWWSVKPPEYENIKNYNLIDQCIYQVYYVEKYLNSFLNSDKHSQFKIVKYESLCEETMRTVSDIKNFLEKNGIKIHEFCKPDNNFNNHNTQYLEDSIFKEIYMRIYYLWKN